MECVLERSDLSIILQIRQWIQIGAPVGNGDRGAFAIGTAGKFLYLNPFGGINAEVQMRAG